jgi:hypothetical protein
MTIHKIKLPCLNCKAEASFIFDDDDPNIKDKQMFMLATLHGNPPRVLIVTFDKRFKVRRTKCLPLQIHEEKEDTKEKRQKP